MAIHDRHGVRQERYKSLKKAVTRKSPADTIASILRNSEIIDSFTEGPLDDDEDLTPTSMGTACWCLGNRRKLASFAEALDKYLYSRTLRDSLTVSNKPGLYP